MKRKKASLWTWLGLSDGMVLGVPPSTNLANYLRLLGSDQL